MSMTTKTAQLSSHSTTVWAGNTTPTGLPDAAVKLLKRWRTRADKCKFQAKRSPEDSREQVMMENRGKVWELAAYELEQELASKETSK